MNVQSRLGGIRCSLGITEKGDINGCVITLDRFGNLITNIDAKLLSEMNTGYESKHLNLEVAGQRISGLSLSYDDQRKGHPLVLINSRGYLEIAVNKGSAADTLQVGVGEAVKVKSK